MHGLGVQVTALGAGGRRVASARRGSIPSATAARSHNTRSGVHPAARRRSTRGGAARASARRRSPGRARLRPRGAPLRRRWPRRGEPRAATMAQSASCACSVTLDEATFDEGAGARIVLAGAVQPATAVGAAERDPPCHREPIGADVRVRERGEQARRAWAARVVVAAEGAENGVEPRVDVGGRLHESRARAPSCAHGRQAAAVTSRPRSRLRALARPPAMRLARWSPEGAHVRRRRGDPSTS